MNIKQDLQKAGRIAWNAGKAAARVKDYLLALGVTGLVPADLAILGSGFLGIDGAKRIVSGIQNKDKKDILFGSAMVANAAAIAAASAVGSPLIAQVALLPVLGMFIYDRRKPIKQFFKNHFTQHPQTIPDPGQPVYPFEKPVFKTNPDHGPVHVNNRSIIVQIDGLSYAALQMAFKMGMVPKKVREFFEKNHYEFKPFYCGQGSVTPSSEAGFLYGTNVGVPAFWFIDPKSGKLVSAQSFKTNLKKYLVKPQPGLLAEGSAYAMLLDGDAKKTMMVPYRIKKNIITQGLDHTSQALGSPEGSLDSALDFSWNLLSQLKPMIKKKPEGAHLKARNLFNYFENNFTGTIVRDATTSNLVNDIKSGVPISWIDLAGYDSASHQYGPFSKTSLNTLYGIFGKIEEVIDAIEKNPDKDYHLYLLSDHGQTPSEPFSQAYGKPLKQLVQGLVGSDQTAVTSLGSHAYIYFTNIKRPMDLSEVKQNHPEMVEKLLSHPGVAIVAGKQDGKTIAVTKQGTVTIKDGKIQEGNAEWLKSFGPPEIIAYEIDHDVSMYNAGHLVLYGTYTPTPDGKGFAVSFDEDDYFGNHEGIGGHQEIPFVGHSARDPIDTKQIMGSWDMHHQLVRNVTAA